MTDPQGAGARTPIRSDMGFSTPDRVVVQGRDLPGEIIGHLDLGAMAFLEITGRIPTKAEARVFNALLVTLVEHGMTPQAMAARLVYLGAPEALQAAVAAGLCGMGSMFGGGAEAAARMLQEANGRDAPEIVESYIAARRPIPGLGHPVHKPVDPRTARLFDIAAEHGFSGPHVALLRRIAEAAEQRTGRTLPINATGAIGAVMTEMGFDWRLCRGVAVIGRAVGLVGHIAEELRAPIARTLWEQTEGEVTQHALEAEAP
ncbi:citryl-CoA lyase (plasmid) [Roseomonas sp. OT10]|uniref:citryl-CoA lyase n=1 Tax=Roseomonas cutis TaxID=2897332 RepID=UPI001E6357E5|nr:citryl-CoA lyase [Roseomonas sp. OT10]UFN51536.1 citryl-CoA lyase [Roseomonas sp. OT10]